MNFKHVIYLRMYLFRNRASIVHGINNDRQTYDFQTIRKKKQKKFNYTIENQWFTLADERSNDIIKIYLIKRIYHFIIPAARIKNIYIINSYKLINIFYR